MKNKKPDYLVVLEIPYPLGFRSQLIFSEMILRLKNDGYVKETPETRIIKANSKYYLEISTNDHLSGIFLGGFIGGLVFGHSEKGLAFYNKPEHPEDKWGGVDPVKVDNPFSKITNLSV